jgi:2-(1,2-epoxy-1,2-dihydrophenyl)acetyl-CoA isomerase
MSTTEERSSQTTASSPASAPLETAREGGVLILTLNRPDRLNALTEELHSQLLDALKSAASDETVAVLVLTGAGRAFCSGGDMGTKRSNSEHRPTLEERSDELLRHSETVLLLHTMPKPTLAMVNGVAAGAGLALALACDLRIASREAVLTTSYIKVALSGDLGSSYFLSQLVGSAKARELLFLSEKLDADSALRMGLVSRVEEPGALREETLRLARQLAASPSVALRYIKRNINCAETATLEQVLQTEALAMARCGRTQDVKEAALAFREKRPPVFKGY